MSKWARSTALTACSMICDRLKPSWHTGITKSDFCRLMGIRSIKKRPELWNTRNRGGLEEKRTACFHELSHYVDERRGILQVLCIRETWKREEYIELIGRPKECRFLEILGEGRGFRGEFDRFRFDKAKKGRFRHAIQSWKRGIRVLLGVSTIKTWKRGNRRNERRSYAMGRDCRLSTNETHSENVETVETVEP